MNNRKDNRRRVRRGLAVALWAVCLLGLAACGAETVPAVVDILTQKDAAGDKTQVTVLVKYAFTIDAFEQAVEEKFPDVDIVQAGNYTRNSGHAEYERRMEHDDLTDIVMTWPLEVGEEYWDERLLDLSGYDFTSRYNLSMLNNISREGALYYLPGPSQIRGIVYNKTLFEENGWKVPSSYESFLALCRTIEESGIRAIQLGFANGEVLDTAFVGYNYANSFSKPQDSQWIADYNSGIGSFGDHFGMALDVFQKMIDAGIWKPEDLDVDYSQRETMLFTRQCAMVEDSVLLARMGEQMTGTKDEFALMPFFNPSGKDSDWARLYMVCYVGVNQHLAESANKEKFSVVMDIMDYISTPEGQAALSADTGAMYSSLIGVPPPDVKEIEDLVNALNHGRYAIFPQLKNAQGALRAGLGGMLLGETTKEDVIRMVDEENRNPPKSVPPKVLGTATADFTMIETGSFVTDAMRAWSGCDIALFLDNGKDGLYNGKGLSGRLYAGEVTDVDISCIMPDFKNGEKGTIWKMRMTGKELLSTLEFAIPTANHQTGWFYYFSGLKLVYDPQAPQGKRVQSITLADGSALDESTIYTVAVTENSIPVSANEKFTETNTTVEDIVQEAIRGAEIISPVNDGRFQIK